MNVFNVKVTTQAEEQISEIAYYISVTLKTPDAAMAMPKEIKKSF